ncbi:MAG: c-type cytochrome [Thermoanaerobaculia bacterium]
MLRKIGRWALRLVVGIAGLVLLLLLVVQMRWKRTFTVPYPAIQASTDPVVIEHGRRLFYGQAACAYCHVPRDGWARLDAGEMVPPSGAHRFPLPFGPVYSANLTSDVATGIGGRTDAELARTIRNGVRANGRAIIPLMDYPGMSDDELVAVISYIRTLPPVVNQVPEHELNMLGKALMAFAIGPQKAETPPPAVAPASAPTIERGKYLVLSNTLCADCHTKHSNEEKGKLAGGDPMEAALDPKHLYVPPNLTPDPATGHITGWTEETFLARFRAGPVYKDGVMPWGAYGRMSDDDIRAIYRYLKSLPPIVNDTGPAVVDI